jgi:hypothetical protein
MGAQRKALRHPSLSLAYDEFILAERTASTCVATLDKNSLWHRPSVFTCRAVHALGFDGNELHVAAAAAAT